MPSDTPPAATRESWLVVCAEHGADCASVGFFRSREEAEEYQRYPLNMRGWHNRGEVVQAKSARIPDTPSAPVPRVGEGGTPTPELSAVLCTCATLTQGHIDRSPDCPFHNPARLPAGERTAPRAFQEQERASAEFRRREAAKGNPPRYPCGCRILFARPPEEAAVPTTCCGQFYLSDVPGDHHKETCSRYRPPASPAVAVPGEGKSMSENDLDTTENGQLESSSARDATEPEADDVAQLAHARAHVASVFRLREGETLDAKILKELADCPSEWRSHWWHKRIRKLCAALSTERAAREGAERNVEDWHRCAMSSFADFVASDKKLSASEAALTTTARHRDALREALQFYADERHVERFEYLADQYVGRMDAVSRDIDNGEVARAALSRPTAGEQTTGTHPEDTCQHCGGPNVVWFAPNDLWNSVMGGEAGIVCPRCFVLAAEKAGVNEIWKLAPDRGDHRLLDRTYTLTAHGIPLPLTGRQLLANMARAEDAAERPEADAVDPASGTRADSRSIPPSPDTATTSKVPNV